MFDVGDLVVIVSAYHAAGIALALALYRRSVPLTALLLAYALHMATNALSAQFDNIPAYRFGAALSLLYGPLFFITISELAFRTARKTRRYQAVHLSPALVALIFPVPAQLLLAVTLISIVAYASAAIAVHYRHRTAVSNIRSDDDLVSLRWVYFCVLAFGSLGALDVIREITFAGSGALIYEVGFMFTIVSATGLLTYVALKSTWHQNRQGQVRSSPVPNQMIDEATALNFFRAIDEYLKSNQLWLDPTLTVAKIAKRTGYSAREVSRAVNVGAGANFSNYINQFRVEHFNRLIADPAFSSHSNVELAFEAGFNSKPSFNRVYRKLCGVTPSQARQRANEKMSTNS